MESIAAHIADDVPLDNISALANALPLDCFDATSVTTLIHLLKEHKLHDLDDSRKIYLSNLVGECTDLF